MFFSIGFSSHAFAAGGKSCSKSEAIAAEEEASTLRNWAEVYKSFKRFAQCDEAAIGEGYSDTVARLLTNDWESIGELDKLISHDKRFRRFVLHHVDELMTFEQAQKMYVNVKSRCPIAAKELCKTIENRLNETPTGK